MTWNEKIVDISDKLQLTLHPQAVKMMTDADPIPAYAVRAKKFGHMAYCQAQAMAKRDGMTVYMDKKDHWCWAPLVGFGLVDCSPGTDAFNTLMPALGISDPAKAPEFFKDFPMLPYGKYTGTLVGPAESVDYEPDVILINCDNNFQLRTLFRAIKNRTGKMLTVEFEALDSCIYTIVKSMLTGEYTVAIPDPGEQERAMSTNNEIILCLPFDKLDELYDGMVAIDGPFSAYRAAHICMEFDFPVPPFYNKMFKAWGLDQGREMTF